MVTPIEVVPRFGARCVRPLRLRKRGRWSASDWQGAWLLLRDPRFVKSRPEFAGRHVFFPTVDLRVIFDRFDHHRSVIRQTGHADFIPLEPIQHEGNRAAEFCF